MIRKYVVLSGFLFLLSAGYLFTATSVSQYGITFNFAGDHEVGRFANGDWWVKGPVTITSITPAYDGSRNGWEVNPRYSNSTNQGFDYRMRGFTSSLVPDLPYTATGNKSIVKVVSASEGGCSRQDFYAVCLKTAAVLTVLDQVPADNGAALFRPPYVGPEKTMYSTNDIHTDLLPSYSPVASTPSLTWVYDRFKRVQFEHKGGALNREMHPMDNMANYPPDNAVDNNEAILRLMFDEPMADKLPGLIAVLQSGIDAYHAVLDGQTWPAGAGYQPGHRVILTFTALMLGDEKMKNTLQAATFFNEDQAVYRSSKTGRVLFGLTPPRGSEKTQKDPYEYIDGGNDPGGQYQFCCLSQPWKGSVLSGLLMPAMQEIWNGPDWEELLEYTDRWVTFGTWTLPDPYNRFPEKHGTSPDGGHRRSNFVDAMWTAYRISASSIHEPNITLGGSLGNPDRVIQNTLLTVAAAKQLLAQGWQAFTIKGNPVGKTGLKNGIYFFSDERQNLWHIIIIVK